MPLAINRIISSLSRLAIEYHWFLAGAMLVAMFWLGISSMAGESAIVDEVAHIPAAYSYDHFGDYRLNPEHPPLIKNLAGLPLQFLQLQFPTDEAGWTTAVNGQWDTGWNFLYHIGNNASAILFWARLPILLLGVFFGWLLYWYSRRHWGVATGLLVLLFYSMSPNILAHARYVTTDLGASVFIFIGLITFLRFVRQPTASNLFLLSLALAVANLAKFNAVLLYPFCAGMAVIAALVGWRPHDPWLRVKLYLGGFISASALSVVWIWLYYIPNTLNTPVSVQDNLISGSLVSGLGTTFAPWLLSMSHVAILKPLVQYLLGLLMVMGRVAGGNVTYFNGVVTNQSFHMYFPELFVVKTQIALLILMLVTGGVGLGMWLRRRRTPAILWSRFVDSLRHYLIEWTLGLFALFYFVISVAGNLDLGVRHILPVYIPLFIVVAIGTVKLSRRLLATKWRGWTIAGLVVLTGWYALSTFVAYPSYLSYFNELIGGGAHADKYFSDSSVDWGQDLIHLKAYMHDNHINEFALDYFGGADPRYYFCARAYDDAGRLIATADGYNCDHSPMTEWHSQNGTYTGQYIAVSETFLENDRYYSVLNQQPGYDYLRAMTPVAKVGNSIYVYKLY